MTSDLGDPSQKDDPYHEMGRPSKNEVKLQMTHLKYIGLYHEMSELYHYVSSMTSSDLFGLLVSYQLKKVGFQVTRYSEVIPFIVQQNHTWRSFRNQNNQDNIQSEASLQIV